uniref:Uncharacterized protein n=1 Tax=Anopheles culicifacies TaxID=139723 RepID=A0A182MQL5_9DIPT
MAAIGEVKVDRTAVVDELNLILIGFLSIVSDCRYVSRPHPQLTSGQPGTKPAADKTNSSTNLLPNHTSSTTTNNLSPSSTAILHHGTTMVTVKSSPSVGGSNGSIATATSPTSLVLTTVGRAETASGNSSSASSSPSAASSPGTVSLSGLAKKPRPKTVSPTRHGPQQCQFRCRAGERDERYLFNFPYVPSKKSGSERKRLFRGGTIINCQLSECKERKRYEWKNLFRMQLKHKYLVLGW